VDAAAPPIGGRQRPQESQHLTPPPLPRGQRLVRVAPEVLALDGPAIGIERMTDRAADAPADEILRLRAEREDQGLVDRQDRVEGELEELFHVAQETHDLGGRPTPGRRPASERSGRRACDRSRNLIRRAFEPAHHSIGRMRFGHMAIVA
jgi:hypothetical protein